jgi:hypothetical protein
MQKTKINRRGHIAAKPQPETFTAEHVEIAEDIFAVNNRKNLSTQKNNLNLI